MPRRFFDVQALFHSDSSNFSWDNGNATKTSSTGVLVWFIIQGWLFYVIFSYFTLINYSYFVSAKKWTAYTGYNLA